MPPLFVFFSLFFIFDYSHSVIPNISFTPSLSLPSTSHPLLYVHLPKCAGTSMRKSLHLFSVRHIPLSNTCIPCENRTSCHIFSLSQCGRSLPVVVAGHFQFEETKSLLHQNYLRTLSQTSPSPLLSSNNNQSLSTPANASSPSSLSRSESITTPPSQDNPQSPSPKMPFNLTCITYIRDPFERMVSMYYFVSKFAFDEKEKAPYLSSFSPQEIVKVIDVVGDYALRTNFGPHKLPLLQQFGSMEVNYNETFLFSLQSSGKWEDVKSSQELEREGHSQSFQSFVRALLKSIRLFDVRKMKAISTSNKSKKVDVSPTSTPNLKVSNEISLNESAKENLRIRIESQNTPNEGVTQDHLINSSIPNPTFSPKELRAISRAHYHLRQCVIFRVEDPKTSYFLSKYFVPTLSSAIAYAAKIKINRAPRVDATSPLTPLARNLLWKKYFAEMELYQHALSLHRQQLEFAFELNRTSPEIFQAADQYRIFTPVASQIKPIPTVQIQSRPLDPVGNLKKAKMERDAKILQQIEKKRRDNLKKIGLSMHMSKMRWTSIRPH